MVYLNCTSRKALTCTTNLRCPRRFAAKIDVQSKPWSCFLLKWITTEWIRHWIKWYASWIPGKFLDILWIERKRWVLLIRKLLILHNLHSGLHSSHDLFTFCFAGSKSWQLRKSLLILSVCRLSYKWQSLVFRNLINWGPKQHTSPAKLVSNQTVLNNLFHYNKHLHCFTLAMLEPDKICFGKSDSIISPIDVNFCMYYYLQLLSQNCYDMRAS